MMIFIVAILRNYKLFIELRSLNNVFELLAKDGECLKISFYKIICIHFIALNSPSTYVFLWQSLGYLKEQIFNAYGQTVAILKMLLMTENLKMRKNKTSR